jgi:hypothetical protein
LVRAKEPDLIGGGKRLARLGERGASDGEADGSLVIRPPRASGNASLLVSRPDSQMARCGPRCRVDIAASRRRGTSHTVDESQQRDERRPGGGLAGLGTACGAFGNGFLTA